MKLKRIIFLVLVLIAWVALIRSSLLLNQVAMPALNSFSLFDAF